jgi:hypothetical protein
MYNKEISFLPRRLQIHERVSLTGVFLKKSSIESHDVWHIPGSSLPDFNNYLHY